MIKTFKKALAIMMTFIFVMSLVPGFALAETSNYVTQTVRFSDYGYTRNQVSGGTDYKTHTYNKNGNYIYFSGVYDGFTKLNLEGYEEILKNKGTSIVFYYVGRSSSSKPAYGVYDFNMYVANDNCDTANFAELSYNKAVELNFLDKSRPILYTKSDGIQVKGTSSSGELDVDILTNALDEGVDNSTLAFWFDHIPIQSNCSYLTAASVSTLFSITYDKSKIDNDAYVKEVADKLTWDVISEEDQTDVGADLFLPQKFLGADVKWTSDKEDVVNPSSGEVTINPDAYTKVKLTAELSYTNYLKESNTENIVKEFEIRVTKNKFDYSDGSGIYYDATTDEVPEKSTSGNDHIIVINRVGGFAGKEESDLCYEITDAPDNQRFNLESPSTDATLRDTIEFSVCIPDGCHGLSTFISLFKNLESPTKHGTSSSSFTYRTDGIYRGNNLITSWDGNKWHHVAIVAPGIVSSDANGIVYDTTLKMYVDGVLKLNDDIHERTGEYPKPYGVRYCQVNGLSTYDSTSETFNGVAYYLDNLRWTNDTYVPEYNTKSSVVTNYDIDHTGETITVVTSGTTAGDVKNSLTIDEDAVARMYDSKWNLLSDDVVLSDGCMLVVADANGTTSERSYAYYEIRVMDSGDIAFDVPFINLDGSAVKGNVKVFNYSGENKTYKVFLAVYNGSELIGITNFETLTAENGKITEFTTDASLTFASGNKAKLFVWENNEITPKLASVSYK